MSDLSLVERMWASVHDSTHAMGEIDVLAKELDDPPNLASLLADLADLRRAVSEAYKAVEQQYVATAGEKKMEVPGLGLVEIKKNTTYRQWQHDPLWARVSALALDERKLDPETGELLEREAETVARILRDCCTPSWKVTGLRAHGIQVDEFCEVEDEGWTVRLPNREGGF
jgi:hypothetical protein